MTPKSRKCWFVRLYWEYMDKGPDYWEWAIESANPDLAGETVVIVKKDGTTGTVLLGGIEKRKAKTVVYKVVE